MAVSIDKTRHHQKIGTIDLMCIANIQRFANGLDPVINDEKVAAIDIAEIEAAVRA
mgnify:CR=1 FL=1